jgi:hypothetical protein
MNVNCFIGYERCDEIALHRWENEGGCMGVRPQPRLAVPYSSCRDLVAMRNSRTAVREGPSGQNSDHRYRADGRLPSRGKALVAATVTASRKGECRTGFA